MTTAPDAAEPAPAVPACVVRGARCIRCGYDLAGLPLSDACPECASPVANSLRILLRYSTPEHLARLHRGAFFVQAALIGGLLSLFANAAFAIITWGPFGLAAALSGLAFSTAGNGSRIAAALGGVSALVAAASAFGWWRFTTPNSFQASQNEGETPRRLIRVAVALGLVLSTINLVVLWIPAVTRAGGILITRLLGLVRMAELGALAAIFFASILYLRWLAPRLPDARVRSSAERLMWLGPLLCVVGCFSSGLGLLAAFVLYFILLDRVREDLKALRAAQART